MMDFGDKGAFAVPVVMMNFGDRGVFVRILGFHCHAIEKKNRNHSMNEVKKLSWYRG